MEISNSRSDEHAKRSPDCPFFSLIQNHKQSPAVKRTKSKRDRTSKASRLSTQSSFTVPTEDASLADLPAEEGDSILTTATTATATGKKMGKGKKPAAAKGRKARAKKTEPIGVETAPEPEDDDFEVKVDKEPKPTRGRKRKSDQTIESSMLGTEAEAPQPKRRATRTRGSMAVDDSMIDEESVPTRTASQPKARKGRASTKSTRKASAASAASLRAPIPNDDEIDQALETDLERPLTDDEAVSASAPAPKKGTRSSKVSKSDHAMFSAEPMEVDEAAIDAELEAMEVESNPPPKAKGVKGKQPRKPSAKQQAAAAKKAAEAEAAAEAERLAEEEAEASRQIEAEFEKSISIQHSSPIIQPKKQRASRQPAKRATGRATRGSVMPVNESNISMADEIPGILDEQKDDSGNETDASMASQSTVVRGGASRRGSTMKKGRGGKKAASRNIQEIVRKPQNPVTEDEKVAPSRKGKSIVAAEEIEEPVAILEDEGQAVEEPAPKPAKTKAAKPRGRPAKAAPAPAPAPASVVLETSPEMDETIEEPAPILPKVKASKGKAVVQAPRSPRPPPKEATPSQSPQSSDAENQPPSSKPSAAPKKVATPHSTTTRVPLASTPVLSPSKRNIIAGLQTAHPWKAVDLDAVFLNSPSSNENSVRGLKSALDDAMEKAKNGDLTSPEKKMSVEEWIHYNAGLAEEKLRGECERLVGIFEREGGRAMRALEGVECVE
jgi:hypothetical protein